MECCDRWIGPSDLLRSDGLKPPALILLFVYINSRFYACGLDYISPIDCIYMWPILLHTCGLYFYTLHYYTSKLRTLLLYLDFVFGTQYNLRAQYTLVKIICTYSNDVNTG